MEWSQVEFDRSATLHVRRAKNGKPATHPIRGDELRAFRELQRQTSGGYVFETERGTPFTTDAVNRLVKRIGERADFPFKVSRAHATARLRLCAGQCGPRHTGNSGLAWPSRHPTHRPVYGIEAKSDLRIFGALEARLNPADTN